MTGVSIVTLEQELQELVERMLDDSDLASFADVVSRAKAKIGWLKAALEDCAVAADEIEQQVGQWKELLTQCQHAAKQLQETCERQQAEIEQLRAALKETQS